MSTFIRLRPLIKHQPDCTSCRNNLYAIIPHLTLGVCVGPHRTAAVSRGHRHSCPLALVNTSTENQHKSFKPLKLKSISQGTKESFLRICNKAMKRFIRLKSKHCYLFKSNPIQKGQKALYSYLLPFLYPEQCKLHFLPGAPRTGPGVTEDPKP